MNFTDVQKEGCLELLKQLPKKVIFSLVDTISTRSITVSSEEEAIQAIISFSLDAKELLNRKKITRDHLMQYVFTKNISIPGKSDKQELMYQLLNYWSNSTLKTVQDQPTSTNLVEINAGNVVQFGQTFSTWFYTMFNSKTESSFNPDHFWPDSTLYLCFITGEKYEEEVQGADICAYKLKRLVSEENLYFNANIGAGGVMSKSESCGIVRVTVQGTVHKNDYCLGVFEQLFSLIRDPLSKDNWKIKSVKLKICTK